MKRHIVLAGALVGAMAGFLPASAQPASPAQACLTQNRVDGWKVIDDQTLIVNDPVGRKFKVTLARGCHDLQFPMHLGFTAGTTSSISCLQRHGFVYVPANGPDIPQRCLIDDVQPYTAEMQHADAVAKASSH